MNNVFKTVILFTAIISLFFSVQSFDIQNENEIVQVGNETFWKYYSPTKSLDDPSNNINIIFDDTEGLEEQLLESWSYAEGTDRYAYINQQWQEESYQLEDGDYFGTRYHIRVYEADEFAIGQAHFDIWDWFGLKHQVTNEGAANRVKSSINAETTEIEIGQNTAKLVNILLLSIIAALVTNPKNRKYAKSYKEKLALFGSPIIILLTARILSITLERIFSINPYLITASFYILIAVGIPISIYILSKKLKKFYAAFLPFIGFITGLLLDYSVIGVDIPNLNILAPRLGLAGSLGIIGYYSSQTTGSLKNINSKTVLAFGLWGIMLIFSYLSA